jgi:hypothetical protein
MVGAALSTMQVAERVLVYRSVAGNAEDDEDGRMFIDRGRVRLQLEKASGGNPAMYYLSGDERAGNFDNPTLRIPVNYVERMEKRRIRSGDGSVDGILRIRIYTKQSLDTRFSLFPMKITLKLEYEVGHQLYKAFKDLIAESASSGA